MESQESNNSVVWEEKGAGSLLVGGAGGVAAALDARVAEAALNCVARALVHGALHR